VFALEVALTQKVGELFCLIPDNLLNRLQVELTSFTLVKKNPFVEHTQALLSVASKSLLVERRLLCVPSHDLP
jgi:hypothetical protein